MLLLEIVFHNSGPLWPICVFAGLGLLMLLIPGFFLAWNRLWSELGGSRPIEGHFFWSKTWIRLLGLFVLGFACFVFFSRTPTDRRETFPSIEDVIHIEPPVADDPVTAEETPLDYPARALPETQRKEDEPRINADEHG